MAFAALLVTAAKLAGVLATVTVAANAFSFSRYRKKNLRHFQSPIDESSEILASFNVDGNGEEDEFFFGLATAPAHVEDRLNDAWLQFAEAEPCEEASSSSSESEAEQQQTADALLGSAAGDGGSQAAAARVTKGSSSKQKKSLKIALEAMIRGFKKYVEEEETTDEIDCHHNVAAWHNVPHPEERLKFWSDPDTEITLAKDTGVGVFRLGIDWTRIMPEEPVNGLKDAVNFAALERYKWIISRVRSYGMKVMLTLFHHSLPPWAGEYGGWKLEKTVDYFMDFTRLVVDSVSGLVDYWVIFNEPHVFCMLTYCAGAWPGGHPDMLEVATSALPMGVFNQAMHWMAIAHTKAYDYIHQNSISTSAIVGVAHHVSFMRPYGLFDVAAVTLANSLTVFPYVDSISDKLDFIGINYYGQEVVSGAGLKLVENDEYSESGRGVYPDGLYRVLIQFHERYRHLKLPFIISENGISDETDVIRRPYMLEHLLAVYAAMIKGVPVLGYVFWTISDNWEWADGYGPKFGLVAVDRENNLARVPRPSYHLFSKVVTTGKITRMDRARAWNDLQAAAKDGKTRPFYREVNKHGLMYAGGLDEPIQRPFILRDWRFGHYEMEGLQDPLSRLSRCVLRPFSFKRRRKHHDADAELVLQPLTSA
ncbi:Beta-glucosidase-like sfr2, chloroplastic [Turnera subulata]|uniref:Beta-glucosidase-like sfr2, chloroplastic n=1 Tax=Turnera subulata TaxID=218843 RepID=A0A9Q0J818_9ROSI|nr:Beta-glucosidase-like sfr2, chloroplastic [Turnera subulata]